MLQPAEKKIIGAIAILGLIGGAGYLIAEQLKKSKKPKDGGFTDGLPPAETQIITTPPANVETETPVVALPIPLQYNVNTPLFYKSGYTKMIKTLQSIINNISARNGYPLIAVDGIFGMQTLTKVRAYFGGKDNVTLKKAFEFDALDKKKRGNKPAPRRKQSSFSGGAGGSY
jgi:hypothetical protein